MPPCFQFNYWMSTLNGIKYNDLVSKNLCLIKFGFKREKVTEYYISISKPTDIPKGA